MNAHAGGDLRGEPAPAEAVGLLALGAVLFWGGGFLLAGMPPTLFLLVLPSLAFLAPSVAWAWARGLLREAFPLRKLSLREGLASAAWLVGGSLLALAAAGAASWVRDAGPETEALQRLVGGLSPGMRLLLLVLLPALCEEALFRGSLMACLKRWPAAAACLASGLLFGLFHGSLLRFVPVAILGTALAAVRWRTGNILVCVAGHACHNALVLSAMGAGGEGQVGWGVVTLMAAAGAAAVAAGCLMAGRPRGAAENAAPEETGDGADSDAVGPDPGGS